MTKVSKTKKDPLISVIIPVYNVEDYLDKCLESVVNQTYKNLEIILIDDGSTDSSGKMCDAWAKKDKRIKVIHQKNGGLSAARNTGIKVAKSDYIGFVDSDDWIHPEMYDKLFTAMFDNDADISVCSIKRATKHKQIVTKATTEKYTIYNQQSYMQKFFKIGSQTTEYYAWNKLYKSSLLSSNQYPIGLTSEDVVGTYKAVLKAKKIVTIPNQLYFYYQNKNGITGSFSEKDFDLIPIWDLVVKLSNDKPDYLEYAKINRARINFTLLYRITKARQTKRYTSEVQQLRQTLKTSYIPLMKSNIAISRKIFITILHFYYPLIAWLFNVLGGDKHA